MPRNNTFLNNDEAIPSTSRGASRSTSYDRTIGFGAKANKTYYGRNGVSPRGKIEKDIKRNYEFF